MCRYIYICYRYVYATQIVTMSRMFMISSVSHQTFISTLMSLLSIIQRIVKSGSKVIVTLVYKEKINGTNLIFYVDGFLKESNAIHVL